MLLTALFRNEDGGTKPSKYCCSWISHIFPWVMLSFLYLVSAFASDITSQALDPRPNLSCNLEYQHCHFHCGSLALPRKCAHKRNGNITWKCHQIWLSWASLRGQIHTNRSVKVNQPWENILYVTKQTNVITPLLWEKV